MNSSEEGDVDHDQKEYSTQGKNRSYECTFCKRGFTNAQALGGHMNIHRKDRAKAKQPTNSSSQLNTNKFFTNDEAMTFPIRQDFDQMYYNHQYPTATPNYLNVGNYQASNVHGFQYEYPRASSNWPNLHLNQELQGANLSLQIGSSHQYQMDNTHRRGNQEENEVDLELRLGHDP